MVTRHWRNLKNNFVFRAGDEVIYVGNEVKDRNGDTYAEVYVMTLGANGTLERGGKEYCMTAYMRPLDPTGTPSPRPVLPFTP